MPRLLNIGSGPIEASAFVASAFPDWEEVRLDISPEVKPDVLTDAAGPLPFEDETFDAVWASHILEHIPRRKVPTALREWRRVLKEEMILHVQVPDAKWAAKRMLELGIPDPPVQLVFNGQGEPDNRHLTVWTLTMLRGVLEELDFNILRASLKEFNIMSTGRGPLIAEQISIQAQRPRKDW